MSSGQDIANEIDRDCYSEKPTENSEAALSEIVICTRVKLVGKQRHDDESWVAILENVWTPQSLININFPYPDDVEIGHEMFLTLSASNGLR